MEAIRVLREEQLANPVRRNSYIELMRSDMRTMYIVNKLRGVKRAVRARLRGASSG